MQNKSRILYLLKYLHENSDENNPVSSLDLMEYLKSQEIIIHRTTINSDIKLLIEAGIDIITIKSSPKKYFIGSRQLQLTELKLLVDIVASSKFITAKKSSELTRKIGKLTSKNLSNELKREIFTDRIIKSTNENIYYTIDKIQEAITNHKWLEFRYLEYTSEKELVYKNNGYLYEFSPYTMIASDDHYYAVGYSKKHKGIVTFRVDRIEKPNVLDDIAPNIPTDFNPSVYSNQIFEMFDGEYKIVELKCANELMRVIIDKFGEDVKTSTLGSNHFKVITEVSVSPRFYGWVFGFSGDISILGPTEVKEEYKKLAKKILE